MAAIRLVYAKIIIFSCFIHQMLPNENSDVIAESGHKFWLQSLIGNEEIIPKVTSLIEDCIAPILKNSTNILCRKHSDIYMDGLRNGTPWAYHMLDSTAKLEAGILMGNLVSMGNFDECIGVTDVQTDLGPFHGKHCLASLTWENDTFLSTKKLFDLIEVPGGSNSVTIQWGFCIPSTCGAEDMRAGLSTVLHRDVTVTLSELDCHTNEGKKLKIIDYVAIAVFVTFGLSVILSTSYDLLKKGRGKQILISFSLYTNGRKLLSTKDSPETLTCLSGIRILSICWIVLGHRYLLSMNVPSINAITGYGFISDWSTMVIINSVLAVDTFLLVSGLLVAYGQLGHVDRRQKFLNVPLYYLHRYIRLTPALAVMVLMQLSLIEHMGSGPLWDKGNKHLTQLCQENWWSALLYVQNYVSDYRMCVGHSWYLSVDMQLFWISPLILLPLIKWPRKWNLLLLGTLIIGGIIISYTVNYVNEFPAGINAGVGPEWDNRDRYEYITTHARFTPWLIGFGLGYLLHCCKGRKPLLTGLQVYTGWMLSALGCFSAIYWRLPFQQPDYKYNVYISAIYACLNRPIWAFAVGWVIYACVTGYGGPVDKLLSWGAFKPLGRLTYCIYLVHFTYILYRQLTTRTPIYINGINLMSQVVSDVFFSILFAALLSLGFEVPALNVEKVLLRAERADKSDIVQRKSVEDGRINQGFAAKDNR
ncbi:nose resistant to fluoxetine protein 6 [Cryptotermes secundus]|uniref:nose resistant to fluoxetine protein 6 n=1 Tax=Cryptotermes secundus TaxID=105785 RepID=UPI000CD7B739|nr:nose resistant to fluoxetine protein 6 [Cryptotermes secundus]